MTSRKYRITKVRVDHDRLAKLSYEGYGEYPIKLYLPFRIFEKIEDVQKDWHICKMQTSPVKKIVEISPSAVYLHTRSDSIYCVEFLD